MIIWKRFRLTYRLKEDMSSPPYLGSILRGGFGAIFKREVCVREDGNCAICILRKTCPYLYVFETPIPENAKIMKKYTSAPHPFIIEPPLKLPDIIKKGEELSFDLILVGNVIKYLPYFVYTFIRLGDKGIGSQRKRAKLVSVTDGEIELFNPKTRALKEPGNIRTLNLLPKKDTTLYEVKLLFPFPVSIKKDGKIARTIDFNTIMRSFLRRLVLLEYFHNNGTGEYPFGELLKELTRVKIKEVNLSYKRIPRFSSRQRQKIYLEGMVGTITYENVPGTFLPYIRVMEDLHIGKNTSFGLGKVIIEYERTI